MPLVSNSRHTYTQFSAFFFRVIPGWAGSIRNNSSRFTGWMPILSLIGTDVNQCNVNVNFCSALLQTKKPTPNAFTCLISHCFLIQQLPPEWTDITCHTSSLMQASAEVDTVDECRWYSQKSLPIEISGCVNVLWPTVARFKIYFCFLCTF